MPEAANLQAANLQAAEIDAALKADPEGNNPAQLAELHEAAATLLQKPEEKRVHLTHAWVYALVLGDEALSSKLENHLKAINAL